MAEVRILIFNLELIIIGMAVQYQFLSKSTGFSQIEKLVNHPVFFVQIWLSFRPGGQRL